MKLSLILKPKLYTHLFNLLHSSLIFSLIFFSASWPSKGLLRTIKVKYVKISWFPWWLRGKESTCNTGEAGSTPGLIRSPGEGNGNPLKYSCLGYLEDRGAWQAIVHWVEKNWIQLTLATSCDELTHWKRSWCWGSSIHGSFQARVLEWVAIAFSKKEVYQILKVTSKTILSRTHGVSLVAQW